MGKAIVVLSLFDGVSGARQAIERAGIKIKRYYASEIDKPAITATMHNYPDTIQLGDVTQVKASEMEKIDLLIGGSPCQGFSFAGKNLNFDDPRSVLFFEYHRIWKEVVAKNPNAKFLLENVKMKEESERVISKTMGVNPILINSALVSAQNRERNYWTNIGLRPAGLFGDLESTIKQPKDRKIFLIDILETNVDAKYYLSKKAIEYIFRDKMNARFLQSDENEKAGCVVSNYYKGVPYNAIQVKTATIDEGNITEINKGVALIQKCSTYKNRGNTNFVITHSLQPRSGDGVVGKGHLSKDDGKSYSLDTQGKQAVEVGSRIRRLTPVECCRLQTVKDDYFYHEGKAIISETQMYKSLGNGFTIDVIAYILSYY
jgi:DNA-cytosine methyltransferase